MALGAPNAESMLAIEIGDEPGGKNMVLGAPNAESMSYTDFFKARADIMKNFADTAKTYIQISSAGLALPVIFTQALLGKTAAEQGLHAAGVPWTLWATWASFIVSIGFALIYQWLASRRLWDQLHAPLTDEVARAWGAARTWWMPHFDKIDRSILYGGMVIFFYFGAIFRRLRCRRRILKSNRTGNSIRPAPA